ncbi:hypothetical protein ACGC1H_000697 [Rhizoctonia solani]|uniref:Uncharacterized protein n=1 Tax=Rhizoctonia solani TaxID=456999 RepID=A0A8H3AM60_9AGAM|nr:unnamed protein product [Rhizoctonia solani]
MRIFQTHKEGEVEMQVAIADSNGVFLDEYAHSYSDDGRIAYCWIPAVEEQTFEIQWIGSGPKSYNKLDIRATPYLNGSEVDSGILFAHERAQGDWAWLDGQQVSADMARPFKFGRLELAEEDDLAPIVRTEDTYTIRVELEWGWSWPKKVGREPGHHTFECPNITTLLSKQQALAGNYTSAMLGEPVLSDDVPQRNNFRRKHVPSTEFVFQYGPADWLQANAIKIDESPEIDDGVDKEIIDVDEFETISELGLEEQPESETEMGDNFTDELQVEAMIIMDSDSSNNTEVKLELDDCVAQTKEGTATSHSNIEKGLVESKVMDSKANQIKSEVGNEVRFNQLNDKEFEDEDVFIYKIMVPVSNLRPSGGDTKVKREPSGSY